MDRNPEFAQVLNNPQQLQEAMQAATNPVCYLLLLYCMPFTYMHVVNAPSLLDCVYIVFSGL